MKSEIFDQISERFLTAESILIITHQKPDGDACGSALALFLLARRLGKEAAVFSVDRPPSYFDFLPSVEEFSTDKTILRRDWELILVVDAGDWPYTGIDEETISFLRKKFVINIDHHFSNDNFGNINLVNSKSSSTCEMIFGFFQRERFFIDKNIATCLLCGILTDTGGFSNSATTATAVEIAGRLIAAGAKLKKVADSLTKNKTIGGLRVWGLVLSRLTFYPELDLAYAYIRESELSDYDINGEEIDGLVNFFNNISEAKWSAFFRINGDQTKASLRTTKDCVNVAAVAGLFGGGGHKKAAGFTLLRPLQDIEGFLRENAIDLKKALECDNV